MATGWLGGLGWVSCCPDAYKSIEGTELHEMHPFVMYIFRVYDYPGVMNELRWIDREVKSDLAGGSKHSTSRAIHASRSTTRKIRNIYKESQKKKGTHREILLGCIGILIAGRADTVKAVLTALQKIPTGKEHHEDSRIYCNDSIRRCRALPIVGFRVRPGK